MGKIKSIQTRINELIELAVCEISETAMDKLEHGLIELFNIPQQPNDVLPIYKTCGEFINGTATNDYCCECKCLDCPSHPEHEQQPNDTIVQCLGCCTDHKQSNMDGDVCNDCVMTDIDDTGINDLSEYDLTAIMNRSGYGDSKIIHHHIVDHEPLRHNETVMQYKIICIFDELNENEYQLFGTVFVSMINHKWELQF